jgi:peptidoglycan/LPS O-acetylase OafA/YrhL
MKLGTESTNHSIANYQAHIDGLRALAVISVVTYHAFPDIPFSGFIGVDIFFVISGFLISSHITSALKNQSFSFASFYRRRVLRLFPALATVILFTLLFGYLTLLAHEYESLGTHTRNSSLFFQNIGLAFESGYFDASAETKPLLHLWSLSIEEQFYLIWPICLFMIFRLGLHFRLCISILILASLYLCLAESDLSSRFYFPQYRFWELMTGALASSFLNSTSGLDKKPIRHSLRQRFGTGIGLGLILVSFFIVSKNAFPDWRATLPVLGTAIILASGTPKGVLALIMGNKYATFVGRISYPIYLWHWPLFSYAYILYGHTPPIQTTVFLIVITFIASFITYCFVEAPLRFTTKKNLTTFGLLLAMITFAAFGHWIKQHDGIPSRNANSITEKKLGDIGHDDFHQLVEKKFYPCTPTTIRDSALRWNGFLRCQQSQKGSDIEVVLLGDSHAEHLFLGLAESMPEKNIAYYILGGLPVSWNPSFAKIYNEVKTNKTISTVVLSSYWKSAMSSAKASGDSDYLSLSDSIAKSISDLIDSGKHVIVTNDLPDFDFDPEACKYARLVGNGKCNQSFGTPNVSESIPFNAIPEIKTLKHNNFSIFDSYSLLCDIENCSMIRGKKILFRDRNHLNLNGARYIGKELAAFIRSKQMNKISP